MLFHWSKLIYSKYSPDASRIITLTNSRRTKSWHLLHDRRIRIRRLNGGKMLPLNGGLW